MHEQPGGTSSYIESITAHKMYVNGWQDSCHAHGQPNIYSITKKQEKTHKTYGTN